MFTFLTLLPRFQLLLYKSLGVFIAKSLADGRIIDFPFNRVFIDMLLTKTSDVEFGDPMPSSSLVNVRTLRHLKTLEVSVYAC